MSQLKGKTQKIADESHDLLNFIAFETKFKMSDLASVLLMDAMHKNFPKMVSRYYEIREREAGQLTEMGLQNEKGRVIFDLEKIPN